MTNLPPHPPKGYKRYKAHSRNANQNPFKGRDMQGVCQTVDIEETHGFEQVERWARESAEEAGYVFLRLEVIS